MSAKPDDRDWRYYAELLYSAIEDIRSANIKALTQQSAAAWWRYNEIRKQFEAWRKRNERGSRTD